MTCQIKKLTRNPLFLLSFVLVGCGSGSSRGPTGPITPDPDGRSFKPGIYEVVEAWVEDTCDSDVLGFKIGFQTEAFSVSDGLEIDQLRYSREGDNLQGPVTYDTVDHRLSRGFDCVEGKRESWSGSLLS